MAYYISDELKINPQEIIDNWCIPQLIVSYGILANNRARENFEQYKQLPSEARAKVKRIPKPYAVIFMQEKDLTNGFK